MKLYAVSDLHLGHRENREALEQLPAQPDDWLVLAGDVGEKVSHLVYAFRLLTPRFKQLIWVPGNHELWTLPNHPHRGERQYLKLVKLCREFGVITPEDPFPIWRGQGGPCVLAPLFLLYDYSFRPDHVPAHRAVDWAMESGIVCADEKYLHPDPYPSRPSWCEARCDDAESRLLDIPADLPAVLINHFPMRRDLVVLPRIPRFSVWCGTRRTEDWHRRFRAKAVVSGHLHIPRTSWRDGVRFEEVSFGYPRQRRSGKQLRSYLREILPG